MKNLDINSLWENQKDTSVSETSKFQSWLLKNGVFIGERSTWGKAPHSCVIASETSDDGEFSGRGLLTRSEVQQNEKIIEVPEDLILGVKTVNKKFPEINSLNEYNKLAITLITEKSLGNKSKWKPYIDILPVETDLNLVFRWNINDIYILKSSKVIQASVALKEKINAQFNEINEGVFLKNPLKFPDRIFNIKSWEWAMSILLSRAIRMQSTGNIALVPYADLLNHNPFSTCFINLKKVPFTNLNEVAMYVDKPYGKFEQIFTSYGSKSNLELLILYGFNLGRNPFDSFEIRVGVSRKDNLNIPKKNFLEKCNKATSMTFPIFYYQYPEELFEFAYFCIATDKEFVDSDPFELEFLENQDKNTINLLKLSLKMAVINNQKIYGRIKYKKMAELNLDSNTELPRNHKIAIKQLRCEDKILNRFIGN